MIVNDRITDYINSLERSRGPLLTEIASKARKERVPVIREETASFLISLENIPCVYFLFHIIQALVIAVCDDCLALFFELL